MNKKQTYIIGDNTPKKKVDKPKKKKTSSKPQTPRNYESKSKAPINTAFADAFAKLGVSSKDFQKK
tara:strand:+ start:2615 stop:2812 length:198 start_codon:yes stop_codon:yes gene_type:complete